MLHEHEAHAVSSGRCFSSAVKASSPPADAPMSTIGNAPHARESSRAPGAPFVVADETTPSGTGLFIRRSPSADLDADRATERPPSLDRMLSIDRQPRSHCGRDRAGNVAAWARLSMSRSRTKATGFPDAKQCCRLGPWLNGDLSRRHGWCCPVASRPVRRNKSRPVRRNKTMSSIASASKAGGTLSCAPDRWPDRALTKRSPLGALARMLRHHLTTGDLRCSLPHEWSPAGHIGTPRASLSTFSADQANAGAQAGCSAT